MAQARQLSSPGGDLALVVGGGGHQHPGIAEGHARPHRLGPEGGEEGGEDPPSLEGAQGGDIEVRHPAQQTEDPLPRGDVESFQKMGEAAGQARQFAISQVTAAQNVGLAIPVAVLFPVPLAVSLAIHLAVSLAVPPQPADGDLVSHPLD